MGPKKYKIGDMFIYNGKQYVVGDDNILDYMTDVSSLYPKIFEFDEETRFGSAKYHYKQLFFLLCDENEDKKAEYITLLKLNDNDYRRTVLQIEYNNLNQSRED